MRADVAHTAAGGSHSVAPAARQLQRAKSKDIPMSRPIGAAPLRAPTNVSETADGTYDEDVEALLSKLEAAPVVDWSELGEMTPVGVGEYCTASACALHGARVAVKRLKQEKQSDPIAVSDLAREAQLLARMRHENVISVVAQGTYACGASARGELPFLCLEMLASTLAAELPPSSVSTSPWVRKAGVRAWPLSRSINVALQISRALRYCHDEWVPGYRLLHRDLKPANVGFTSSGRVVLYDFGLCKLWSRGGGESDTHEMRKLTGLTGSLRYMAPEVALCQPYNHKAEVFSFASLFYEMLACQKPFHWCTPDAFMREVCHEGRRCKLPTTVPSDVSDALHACWSQSPQARPEFRDIVPMLEAAHAAAVAAAQKPARPASARPYSSHRSAGQNLDTPDTEMKRSASPRRPASASGLRSSKKSGLMRIFF